MRVGRAGAPHRTLGHLLCGPHLDVSNLWKAEGVRQLPPQGLPAAGPLLGIVGLPVGKQLRADSPEHVAGC